MKLSLVIPCYNEQDNVELFYNAATEAFKDKGFEYELIFVNDGSRDQTMDKLRHIYDIADENVKVVGFSRNFGKESAIYAGLKESRGEMVCLIDADMQQRPELVLPFVLDKNAAKAALKKYYRGKRFLPNAFSSQNHIEEIKGVYVPFWLFDANASGSGQYEATTSSSHRNGDYVITTTRHYDVRRAGTTQFMGVPVDGSTKMPNGHMDAIEPYDYRAFQPFSTAYLPGYMADKYDEDADTCQARAHSRMQNSVSSELSASITGYNSVSTLSENISIDYTAKHYALLPVWMLHTKWQGKDYLFAMNGQTGKLVGDLPVDNRKVAAWFAGISVPLMILLAILL